MSRITIASSCYPPKIRGGAEISTKSLAELLVRMGHSVQSVSFSELESAELINGVEVVRIKPSKLYSIYNNGDKGVLDKVRWRFREEFDPSLAKQVVKQAELFNTEIFITSTIEDVSTYSWRLAAQSGMKTVHILRSYYLLCTKGSLFSKGKNCVGRCSICKLANVNKLKNDKYLSSVVGLSEFILNEHLKYQLFTDAEKFVIPNVCFESDDTIKTKSKSQIDRIVLGYLGRVHETKGIEELISAISRSANRNRIVLKIAGDGEANYVSQLIKKAALENVECEMLGHQAPTAFFGMIDCLVVPSVWAEPFGRVVIESMFHGVPVIGRNSGGIPELIDSSSGLIYSSEEGLTGCIDDLCGSNLGERFLFSGIERFKEKKISEAWSLLLKKISCSDES